MWNGIGGQRAGGVQNSGNERDFAHFDIQGTNEGMMDSEFSNRRGFHHDRPAAEMQAEADPSPESAGALRRQDFYYDLPPELIAQQPPPRRGDSRLLTLDGASGELGDRRFRELPALLRPGDVLVFNDTRVIPARLFGRKASGGRIEILVERLLDERRALVHLHASKSPKSGGSLLFDAGFAATVLGRHGELFEIGLDGDEPWLALLERHGQTPLPPYIRRAPTPEDRERYQTVYARQPGAVAAPTAGLHFDQELLDRLAERGMEQAFVTLHVGAGTFQPVRVERIAEHVMHGEWIEVGAGSLRMHRRRPGARRPGDRGGHHGGAGAGNRRPNWRDSAVARRNPHFYLPRLPLPVRGRADHQLSLAGIHPADAGGGLRRPRRNAERLPPRGRATLSLLQLR